MAPDNIPAAPAATASSAPQQIIIQQPPSAFGRFGKWMMAALVIAVMIIISLYSNYQSYFTPADMPTEKYHSLAKKAAKKIAIIEISGPIYGGENSFAKKQIDRVREDKDVVGIVLRIDSPGGTVTGSDYIYHHLRALIEERGFHPVVSMGSICASGGYYVAMAVGSQSDAIYAEPTTWTGSIGVIIPHFDFAGALSTLHIDDDSIVSGPLKEMGSPTKPMSLEERKVLQTLVDESFKGFKEIVQNGRPKFKADPAALDKVATGQVFTAQQALDLGLVDRRGFIEEAIARAAELAHESPESVRCVKYEQPPSLLGELTGVNSMVPPRGTAGVAALIDFITPRPYYLWSWLPTLSTSN
jgi:protease-4